MYLCKIFKCLISIVLFFNNYNVILYPLTFGSNSQVDQIVSSIPTGFHSIQYLALFNNLTFDDSGTTCIYSTNAMLPISGNIDLNGGILVLDRDLTFHDTLAIISEGKIYARVGDSQSVYFPGSIFDWGYSYTFRNLAMFFSADLNLTNHFTFNTTCTLDMRNRKLDVSSGALFLTANSDLTLKNTFLYGLKDTTFNFGNDNCRVHMMNVTLQQTEDITFNSGLFYVDGPATAILYDHDMTFASNASLTVDSVTFWKDSAGIDGSNIGDITGNISTVNTGTIKTLASADLTDLTDLARDNSEAIVYLDECCETVTTLVAENSEAILGLEDYVNTFTQLIVDNSDAIDSGISSDLVYQNSNAIVWLNECCETVTTLVAENSEAILGLGALDLSILTQLAQDNSEAIVYLDECCETVTTLVADNSNAILNIDVGGTSTCAHLFPGEYLEFTYDQVYDGQGKNIVFSHWNQPQFRVSPGVTVTLKNIELMRINENTFSMGEDSKLKIDEGVLFELSEDVTWDQGRIEIIGDNNVFTVRGIDNRKILTVVGDYPPLGRGECAIMIDVGSGTMLLENVELRGLDHMDCTACIRNRRCCCIVGAIGLGGNAVVNVNYSTYMNFVVKGLENELWIKRNNISFKGSLLYGNRYDNDLHIKFLLENKADPYPRLIFDKEFAFITSRIGWARLIFDDPYVQIYNEMARSFVVSQRSYLGGYTLEILNNPIKQVSRDFVMASGLTLLTDQDNAIEQEFIRSPFALGRSEEVTTVLNEIENEIIDAIIDSGDIVFDEKDLELRAMPSVGLQAGDLPSADLEIRNGGMKLSKAKNSVRVDKGSIFNFGVSEQWPLSLTLANGSVVEQGDFDVRLKSEDDIIVQGVGNKVLVTKKFLIDGEIKFRDLSTLTFEFDADEIDPIVYLSMRAYELAPGSRLIFKGHGKVVFEGGSIINLGGDVGIKKSELVVQDFAELYLDGDSPVLIRGSGKFTISNNSQVNLVDGQQIIIGSNLNDEIDLNLNRNGQIWIRSNSNSRSKFSLNSSKYSVSVSNQSKIHVGMGGIFEINSLNGKEKRGLLNQMKFDGRSEFKIDDGGEFWIGKNLGRYPKEQEAPFTWNNIGGSLIDGGFLGISGADNLSKIQSRNISKEFKVGEFFDYFTNLHTQLLSSNLFVDKDGNRKIKTKNGVVVSLMSGDEVVKDDPISGYISVMNKGNLYVIMPDGRRV